MFWQHTLIGSKTFLSRFPLYLFRLKPQKNPPETSGQSGLTRRFCFKEVSYKVAE